MKLKTRIRRALNYWSWRLSHPAAPYEQYYVHRVMSKIRSGQGHPAIGPTARPLRNESELLEFLLKHGLQPGDLTIDYGCGSLRLAPPLIGFLEPGRYWGMDLAQDFLDLGRAHLSAELAQAKRPRLDVIADDVIQRARAKSALHISGTPRPVREPVLDLSAGRCAMMTPGATPDPFSRRGGDSRPAPGPAFARPPSAARTEQHRLRARRRRPGKVNEPAGWPFPMAV
jgi:hypothetical protein